MLHPQKVIQLDCGNYRSDLLVQSTNMLLEGLVCQQLDAFLEHHSLQAGSRWSTSEGGSAARRESDFLGVSSPDSFPPDCFALRGTRV